MAKRRVEIATFVRFLNVCSWSKGGTVSAVSVRLWPPRAIIHSLDWTEEATQFVAGKCLDNPTLLITFS